MGMLHETGKKQKKYDILPLYYPEYGEKRVPMLHEISFFHNLYNINAGVFNLCCMKGRISQIYAALPPADKPELGKKVGNAA